MEIIVKGSVDFGPDLVAKALFGKSLEEVAKDFIREERTKSAKREDCLQGPYEAGEYLV